MSAPGSGTATTEWWKTVSLEDAACATKEVEDFIVNETGHVDKRRFLVALPLMIMCGGDDPPRLADRITRRTNDVLEIARATSKWEEAKPILQARMDRLNLLGDALARLPGSFKGDPKDPSAEPYKDGGVASVHKAVQSGLADCLNAMLKRGPRRPLELKPTPPRES